MLDWLRFRRHPIGEQELSAYLDGQLSPAQSRRLEEHLASCPACRRKLDDLRMLVEALHALPDVAAPRSFALTREQALPTPLPVGGLYLAFRNAAAAALILLFAFIGADVFLQFHGEPGQPEPVLLGAQRAAEPSLPLSEGGALPDEATGEIEAFEEKEATAPLAVTAQPTPISGASPAAEEVGPPAATALATPEMAEPAETIGDDGDRIWLRVIEGALGGIVLGFLLAAFWVRYRLRHV